MSYGLERIHQAFPGFPAPALEGDGPGNARALRDALKDPAPARVDFIPLMTCEGGYDSCVVDLSVRWPEILEDEVDIQSVTEAIRLKMGEDSGLQAVLKFDCGADGGIVLDGRSLPNRVINDDVDSDCTIHITLDDLVALMNGQMNPMTGYLSGKFRVSGDLAVALKLQRVV